MPSMTSALNMAQLRDLFARLQRKDPGASQEVQALGKGMSDMGDFGDSGDSGDSGTPQRPPTIGIHNDSSDDIPLPEVGIATHLSGRYGEESQAPEQTGAPQAGGSPATSSSSSPSSGGGGHDWGTLLRIAGSGFSSLGSNFGNGNPAEVGAINRMGVERLREDQMNALKQRHNMWDTAYKHSQELPPEVLSDPRFSSLAAAKAALDKDMLDGKIDNEKNVSLLLTELARHKNELDQISQDSKVKQQIAGETQLLRGREEAGLVEPKDYNWDPDQEGPGSGFMTTGTDYANRSAIRAKEAQDLAQDQVRWDTQAKWHKEQMEASAANTRAMLAQRGAAAKTRGQEHSGTVSRQLMNTALGQIKAEGEITDPVLQRQAAIKLVGEQLMQQADNEGLIDETEEGYEFQGQTFPPTPEGIDQLQQVLDRFYSTR